jgi:hypothetical protein
VFQSRPVSPSPVYPAGCVATPADPNNSPPGEPSLVTHWFRRGWFAVLRISLCVLTRPSRGYIG